MCPNLLLARTPVPHTSPLIRLGYALCRTCALACAPLLTLYTLCVCSLLYSFPGSLVKQYQLAHHHHHTPYPTIVGSRGQPVPCKHHTQPTQPIHQCHIRSPNLSHSYKIFIWSQLNVIERCTLNYKLFYQIQPTPHKKLIIVNNKVSLRKTRISITSSILVVDQTALCRRANERTQESGVRWPTKNILTRIFWSSHNKFYLSKQIDNINWHCNVK